jgi:succinate dehydrogenase/fumarate reductase flavoprotein subunit
MASSSGNGKAFDLQRLEWFDLRNMLTVARTVAQSALTRNESRGAHQREDCPRALPQWRRHQRVRLAGDALQITGAPGASVAASMASS